MDTAKTPRLTLATPESRQTALAVGIAEPEKSTLVSTATAEIKKGTGISPTERCRKTGMVI